jgi:alkylation response protein AidB-like acyl-CoA dehydrogenase
MALVLNEEQQMLRDGAKDFFGARAPLSHLRQIRDDRVAEGFSPELWAEMVEMGWTAIIVPEAYGGLEYGYTGLGLVLEESGRTLTPSPLISTTLLATSALILSGNKTLCEQWLPAIASGDKLLSLAFEESAQHRPATTNCRVTPAVGGFQLKGHKQAVIDGHVADAFIISARSRLGDNPDEGVSLFLVPKDAAGLSIETTTLLDNHRSCSVQLDNVVVNRDSLMGPLHGGYEILQRVLDRGRIGMAAEMLGIAQETFERTIEYLKERKQFGVPIGTFQALQHRAAILFGEIELCKSVVLKALQALDEDSDEVPLLASLAKAKCGQTASLATAEGIQMHGGIGMTDEFEIGFFIKRWRALNQQLGDSRYHLERFASLKGY